MLDTYTYVANEGDGMDVLFDVLNKWNSLMPKAFIHMILMQNGIRPRLTIYYRR